jgi:hypothetical protein
MDSTLLPPQFPLRHPFSDRFPLLCPSLLHNSTISRLFSTMGNLDRHLLSEYSIRLVYFGNVGSRLRLLYAFTGERFTQEVVSILPFGAYYRQSTQFAGYLLAAYFDNSSSTVLRSTRSSLVRLCHYCCYFRKSLLLCHSAGSNSHSLVI